MTKPERFFKSALSVGLGLFLGALAGIIPALLLGVGLSLLLGVL